MQHNPPTDLELSQRLRDGDQTAFKQLFQRYSDPLYVEACKRLGCQHDASDLVQETFLAIHLQRSTIKIADSFAPLLFTILRYKIFNHIKKDLREEKYLYVVQHFEGYSKATEADDPLLFKQLQEEIFKHTERMPPRMRTIFRLNKQSGYTPAEIAKLMDLSGQTVRNQLAAAVKRIREGLDASGFVHLFFLNIHLIYALSTMAPVS